MLLRSSRASLALATLAAARPPMLAPEPREAAAATAAAAVLVATVVGPAATEEAAALDAPRASVPAWPSERLLASSAVAGTPSTWCMS